jgi:hypothetical protein
MTLQSPPDAPVFETLHAIVQQQDLVSCAYFTLPNRNRTYCKAVCPFFNKVEAARSLKLVLLRFRARTHGGMVPRGEHGINR